MYLAISAIVKRDGRGTKHLTVALLSTMTKKKNSGGTPRQVTKVTESSGEAHM